MAESSQEGSPDVGQKVAALENIVRSLQERADAAEKRAEGERQRAEAAEKRAEGERRRAEAAAKRAQGERQRAEAAEERAQGERQRAEAAAKEIDRLAKVRVTPSPSSSLENPSLTNAGLSCALDRGGVRPGAGPAAAYRDLCSLSQQVLLGARMAAADLALLRPLSAAAERPRALLAGRRGAAPSAAALATAAREAAAAPRRRLRCSAPSSLSAGGRGGRGGGAAGGRAARRAGRIREARRVAARRAGHIVSFEIPAGGGGVFWLA
eukprot:tig00000282_g23847.t1